MLEMRFVISILNGTLVWSFVSEVEVAEGLVVVGFILLFAALMKTRGIDFLSKSPILSSRVKFSLFPPVRCSSHLGVGVFCSSCPVQHETDVQRS